MGLLQLGQWVDQWCDTGLPLGAPYLTTAKVLTSLTKQETSHEHNA